MALSPLNQRRWRNFRANKRAFWSLVLFSILFGLSLFAEVLANDKPLLVRHDGAFYLPILRFYPETAFGGDFQTEAVYRDVEVQCLIVAAGSQACWDDPAGILAEARASGTAAGQLTLDPIQEGHPSEKDVC
jgi:microcin C transport system permease protein